MARIDKVKVPVEVDIQINGRACTDDIFADLKKIRKVFRVCCTHVIDFNRVFIHKPTPDCHDCLLYLVPYNDMTLCQAIWDVNLLQGKIK